MTASKAQQLFIRPSLEIYSVNRDTSKVFDFNYETGNRRNLGGLYPANPVTHLRIK